MLPNWLSICNLNHLLVDILLSHHVFGPSELQLLFAWFDRRNKRWSMNANDWICTPLKTNMAMENHHFEQKLHLHMVFVPLSFGFSRVYLFYRILLDSKLVVSQAVYIYILIIILLCISIINIYFYICIHINVFMCIHLPWRRPYFARFPGTWLDLCGFASSTWTKTKIFNTFFCLFVNVSDCRVSKRKHPFQEISNGRTHVSRTLKKPEYLISRSHLTERGPLGFGPIQFFMDPYFGRGDVGTTIGRYLDAIFLWLKSGPFFEPPTVGWGVNRPSISMAYLVATQIFFLMFIPDFWGFMIQFDDHIFQMGWFNHQLDGSTNLLFEVQLPRWLCSRWECLEVGRSKTYRIVLGGFLFWFPFGEDFPCWGIFFSDGLVQPPTSYFCCWVVTLVLMYVPAHLQRISLNQSAQG